MSGESEERVTQLLKAVETGNRAASAELMPLVYDELKAVAERQFRRQTPGHTLQPTAVVHEAYMKMAGRDDGWESRGHFVAVAVTAMRQILVNHARDRRAEKRGGADRCRVTLHEGAVFGTTSDVDLLDLHDALERLAERSERQARIVELRVFGGMTVEHAAALLEVSPATVKADWAIARAWLKSELVTGDASE